MMNNVNAVALRRLSGYALAAACLAGVARPERAGAQWSTAYEQHYLPGKFNWAFRNTYPGADRLFNAFDYGHAILYEKLYTDPNPEAALSREYDFITKKLLVSPPRLPLEEAAIEVQYAKLAPEAKMMFDWAHLLHRQIYDVLAMESMSQSDKDAKVEELVRYYKTRPDLAFSSIPKNMDLMEGQPYSLAFRQKYPKFNGLIWGYHWLQVGLYEPMMVGRTLEERQAGVSAAVTRFRQMLENAPENMPRVMPMTAAIAPEFAKRYTEAAIIFDNLHSMHDVVSDILANPNVPRNRKRAEILKAGSLYRDATSFAMTRAEWMDMANMMGVANMGGPAVGLLPGWATPTIERGMPMAKAMAGMNHGTPVGAKAAPDAMKGHDMSTMGVRPDSTTTKKDTAATGSMAGMDHGAMTRAADSTARFESVMTAYMQLTGDSIIRRRIAADTGLRRSLQQMVAQMPAEHRSHMLMMLPDIDTSAPAKSAVPAKPAPRTARPTVTAKTPVPKVTPRPRATKTATKTATKPGATTKKADPMAGMDHSKMPGMAPPPKPPAKKPPTG
ncbi:MAG: hypothetical protein ABIR92_07990 [Gemmatimonadaceae bacterium]